MAMEGYKALAASLGKKKLKAASKKKFGAKKTEKYEHMMKKEEC